ncbi:Protein NUCLEAR FUSION DEFECTIVE 4, partial [Linum perenne]
LIHSLIAEKYGTRFGPNHFLLDHFQSFDRRDKIGILKNKLTLVASVLPFYLLSKNVAAASISAYFSPLKLVLGISQVQLNYLVVASDLEKVFGWSSGLALMYFPLWTVLFSAAFLGLFSYDLQWMVIRTFISLPHKQTFSEEWMVIQPIRGVIQPNRGVGD